MMAQRILKVTVLALQGRLEVGVAALGLLGSAWQ